MLLSISLILFYATIQYNFKVYQLEATQHVNRSLASNIIRDKGLALGDFDNKIVWKKYLFSAMLANPDIDLYFIGLNGELINYAVHEELVVRKQVSITPILAFLKKDSILPIYGDNPKSHDQRIMFSVAPVYKNNQHQGYLYIVLSTKSSASTSVKSLKNSVTHRSFVLRNAVITVTVIVFFVLLSGLVIVRRITSRVQRLSSEMIEFKDSKFCKSPGQAIVSNKSGDEVDQLHEHFYQLANMTIGHIKELKNKDDTRRELVSQICHDIRSPLMILDGYIDMLSGHQDDLSDADKTQYLNSLVSQSDRIKNLIDDLFLLSKLDDVDYPMSRESCNVSELLNDLAQKYQGLPYNNHAISIELALAKHPVKALIDIGMMDRVISNLIENALKLSISGGEIVISCYEYYGKCLISVKDSGPGLSDEDCEHIFDKFYRTQSSLKKGINGSGLGLAICKRIISLHNGEISVVSGEGKGAEFRILLERL